MKIELTEEEREFIQRVCKKAIYLISIGLETPTATKNDN